MNAPVRGLRFTRHADDVAAVSNQVEIADAGKAAEKLQAEHVLAQMKPGMLAHVDDVCAKPTSVREALGKLASSQQAGAGVQHFAQRMSTRQKGAQGRPRCL